MSSARFPGKVLAPLNGQPIISRVIASLAQIIPLNQIVMATSDEPSDDPLAYYVRSLGVSVYRGVLDSVFDRFQGCLREYPCDWFFRISADSPLLDSEILRTMLQYAGSLDKDLITNVQVRTFPKGHSVEMINSATFLGIDSALLSAEEKEHVTKYFYHNQTEYKIVNISSTDPQLAHTSFVVDTLEDLFRLEKFLRDAQLARQEIPVKVQNIA
jgi:spore coat polysaccharide biosynthesis protein SpsF